MNLKRPKMILFDYGQTLISETTPYDLERGFRAMLQCARANPERITAGQLVAEFKALHKRVWEKNHSNVEPCLRYLFRYLFELYGLSFDQDWIGLEQVFWDASVRFAKTDGLEALLAYLSSTGIRSGVISNIDYAEETLSRVIYRELPDAPFEFIIATSEYLFRKPDAEIFKLALKKAGLPAEDVWYCGNDSLCDVAGPAKLGITPVWYQGSPFFKDQDEPGCEHLKIQHWNELYQILKKL